MESTEADIKIAGGTLKGKWVWDRLYVSVDDLLLMLRESQIGTLNPIAKETLSMVGDRLKSFKENAA